jgi:hypothetical protein
MLSTETWAKSFSISVEATPPPIEGYSKRCPRSARQIATLGSDIRDFAASAVIRGPGLLLAEDDRTYNLWCHAPKARRRGELPGDLNWGVLYERRYAFEWLDGMQDWDEVTCDA